MKLGRDKELAAYIEEHAGEEGLRLAKLLEELGEATDTEISERTGEKPSHVRKVLYALYEARAAEYQQKKDKETGWQTFHWKLSLPNARHAMDLRKKRELEKLEGELKFEEEHRFFDCPKGHGRFDYAKAIEVNFACPSCESPLAFEEQSPVKAELKDKIKELKEG
ncbi:MAG TPA: hypothetical protein VM681_08015 [Candidatus Thermoplasmatota archaeon]|nr:hypothetical protein [Candidatus Thermoplasmatota archaeon]